MAFVVSADYFEQALNAHKTGRLHEAERLYRFCVARGSLNAAVNLAIMYRQVGKSEAGLAVLGPFRGRGPHVAYTLANLLSDVNRWSEAEVLFREALEHANNADVRLGLARALLGQGRYPEAWPLFESRIGLPGYPPDPAVALPKWQGEPLQGRRILIWMEQGLGDQIQFARFLLPLRKLGAHVTIACDDRVAPLFAPLANGVLSKSKPPSLTDFDFWDFTMSLPGRLGTTTETIPSTPYLTVPEHYRTKWSGRVRERVGIIWRANPATPTGSIRSVPDPALLAPFRQVAEVVDLQEPRGDLGDLAAILEQVDLLVSVDTGPAHLAGALGFPCWVMLPHHGFDWRWMEGTGSTPWYRSLRLFRQSSQGDWEGLIDEVATAIRQEISEAPVR